MAAERIEYSCKCGECLPADPGEPGLWTRHYKRFIEDPALGTIVRTWHDEVKAGSDGYRRCPTCRYILHDDWSASPPLGLLIE